MAVTNPDEVVTKQDLHDFYEQIKPYLGSYPIAVANKFSKGDLYSTTEKVIGCWTNGKPLYQKTISCGTLPSAPVSTQTVNSKTVATGVSNIDRLVNFWGYARRGSDGLVVPIQRVTSAATISGNYALGADIGIIYVASTNNLRIDVSQDQSAYKESYVTIQYTKTTDSTNSYNYADENDYSTSEKIVGTWIDGSLIYQKTISFGALPNATTKEVAHGISNLKMYVKAFGVATDGTYAMTFNNSQPTGYTTLESVATALNYGFQFYFDKTKIYVKTGNDRSTYTAYVTIQYTKT